MKVVELELLAPARDAATGREAILHGADAVYIGARGFGARASAGNTTEDIAELVEMAHGYGARVYVTVNTIVYDGELGDVESLIWELYRVGVDALIIQDMGILRMSLPPIALHASTQCDIRDSERARFLAEMGFSRLVLARECTLDEIREIREAVPGVVELEGFVHGALCVSYSGDCQAGEAACGRSANRGECPQMCRLAYDLVDGATGRVLIKGKHLLSLRDLNRLNALGEMADAGIMSFKIEGRLKDVEYVKNVVAAYSEALDRVVAESGGRYRRASIGRSQVGFVPDVSRAFNRGFTSYFLTSRPEGGMLSADTPKSMGRAVATVVSGSRGRSVRVRMREEVSNGDGLTYFNKEGMLEGFRVNRVEGDRLIVHGEIDIAAGTTLYRNYDISFERKLGMKTGERKIGVRMRLRRANGGVIALDLEDESGTVCTETAEFAEQQAVSSQSESRRKALSKTGGTKYEVEEITDLMEGEFVPMSVLTDLRRRGLELLDRNRAAMYKYDYRRGEDMSVRMPQVRLDYHYNVSNELARQFYKEHGAVAEDAYELMPENERKNTRVMTTRYCLRREMRACLKTGAGEKLPRRLELRSGKVRYGLEFDCRACRMYVNRID